MAITAARIEANGWVLAITCTGSLGSFASYTLDPDGTPRVSLTSAHGGFVKSSGTAVSGTITRTIIGTKPLRKPVNRTTPLVEVIDETDLGGGSIVVRIALSENVYATDTVGTLAVLAGWRTGESAASGIAITNSSTLVAPIPIMRWADLQYQKASGTWELSLVVASHHPVGFEPVAGVKFTATDGTTVKTNWATSLSWSGTAPDRLRCYTATVDPATAIALTAGLIRCDAEVYPWLGSMRTTDASGTRTMTDLANLGRQAAAVKPMVIGYDPGTSVYAARVLFVDPAGTTTPTAGMVQTTLAAAKAIAQASRPASVSVAVQALYLANRTLPAANGQASATRSGDAAEIYLAAGVNLIGAQAVTTGFQTPQMPIRIIGDPGDSDPRTNCILRSGTAAPPNLRTTRAQFENMTCETGQASLSAFAFTTFRNVTVRAKTGFETSTAAAFTMSASAPYHAAQARNLLWWRTGVTMGTVNSNFGFCRYVQHPRTLASPVVLGCRAIPAAEDGTASTVFLLNGPQNATDLGAQEDVFWAYNDLRATTDRALNPPVAPAATAGTPGDSIRRWVVMNNLVERVGSSTQNLFSAGEKGNPATMGYNIIEGNTFAGNRTNYWYNDPGVVTYADIASRANQAFCNRVANNADGLHAIKQDDFNDPDVANLRIANGDAQTDGYRPHLVDTWSALYSVGYEGNVDARVSSLFAVDSFRQQYHGRRSLQAATITSPSAVWVSDRSNFGTNAGNGDYTPVSGSPLLSRVLRGNSDVDWKGVARIPGGAAGAIEATTVVALVPAGSRSLQAAGAAGLTIGPSLLAAASGRSVQTAGVAAVAIRLSLGAGTAGHRHATAPTLVGWEAAIAPGRAVQRLTSAAAAISNVLATDLLPDGSALKINPVTVFLFPDRPLAGLITLPIQAENRTLLVN